MAAVQGPEISTMCSTNSINSTPGAIQEIFSCSEGHLNVVYEEVQDTSKILDLTGKSEYLVTTCPAYGCHSKGYKEIHIKKDQLSIKRIRYTRSLVISGIFDQHSIEHVKLRYYCYIFQV